VALFENMGFCFGRKTEPFKPIFDEVKKPPVRLY